MKIASTKKWALVAALACLPVTSLTASATTPIPQTAKKSTMTFKSDEEKAGYIIGHQFASSIKGSEFKINKIALTKAFEDGLSGKKSDLTDQESQEFMQKYLTEQQKIISDKNLKAGEEYLNKNKKEKGVVTLPSGLQYKIVSEGKGNKPKATDTVTVNYEGTLINGKVFDSSYERGQPATFPVNGVIKGWTEALQLMPEGSTWMLYIPAALAYGAQAPSQNIGPNATLIFKVNLVSIAKPAAQAPAPAKAAENLKK
ncbi:FKBP-type peptidyl-prolyl cis-trans isomerase [Fluviispira multicolorata]|uniref:Peptidyl-prolyl cis-trans isomerase n=1 Tax=Fluviispira multicolorata TaxID=2654512 RepID=A0A833N2N9_9BACT|nr:FKBP-type peptidyl-prolyl cis-trans isomerase [Fluviispira multicolorata]KAB8033173.1 FKBP-type peptidyl-prolyl cis-trans isomerase [Fluviispira multicolorata]